MHLDLCDICWLGILKFSMNFLIIILAFAKAPSFTRSLNLCLGVAIQAQGSLTLGMTYLNLKLDLPLCLMCCNSPATDYISVLPLVWINNCCHYLQGVLSAATTTMCACTIPFTYHGSLVVQMQHSFRT
jgi:riboflavin transporter FmnP